MFFTPAFLPAVFLAAAHAADSAPTHAPSHRETGADRAGNRGEDPAAATARRFDAIRNQPQLLAEFLRRMPKGGDLHNHLSGAAYAESFIQFAVADGLCVDRRLLALRKPPCDAEKSLPPVWEALSDPALYREMVNAFSMRNFVAGTESGHDHFFDTFGKFGLASEHTGEMLAEVVARAAAEHVAYLELILGPDKGTASRLGAATLKEPGFDFAEARQQLIAAGLETVVAGARQNLDEAEAKMKTALRCGQPDAQPGCNVIVRYIAEVHRGLSPAQVFAEILAGFELAQADARVVGVNLVMPEDAYVEMRDFELHMRMMDFFHSLYPKVHISLHAGELAPGLVPPEDLRFHIRQSILRGHAQRIGHGVDVMYEDDPVSLLKEMARRGILVEICLTSNDVILGVRDKQHPFPIYMKYGVPVAIATDDPGVSRSDMTHEYLRAVETYGLSYPVLKKIVRASLEYSFLPGASLWEQPSTLRRNFVCRNEKLGETPKSEGCRGFLAANNKAAIESQLEEEFERFELATQESDYHLK